jgi:hypothetical protein
MARYDECMHSITFPWYWLKSRLPHKCKNWQTFLGNQKAGVLFCSVCGKIVDETLAPWDGVSIRYDYSEDFSGGTIEPSRFKFTDE